MPEDQTPALAPAPAPRAPPPAPSRPPARSGTHASAAGGTHASAAAGTLPRRRRRRAPLRARSAPPGPSASRDACSRFYSSRFRAVERQERSIRCPRCPSPRRVRRSAIQPTRPASCAPPTTRRSRRARSRAMTTRGARHSTTTRVASSSTRTRPLASVRRQDAGLRQAVVGPAGDAEPQWHPSNPDLLYYLPTNGIGHEGVRAQRGDGPEPHGRRSRVAHAARAGVGHAAWTKSEGSPSADGRYWCFMVDNAVGQRRRRHLGSRHRHDPRLH